MSVPEPRDSLHQRLYVSGIIFGLGLLLITLTSLAAQRAPEGAEMPTEATLVVLPLD